MSLASPRRAMALFAAFALLWALVEEVLGGLLQQAYPLMQIVWCRYAAHLLLLIAICIWRQPQRLWRTGRLSFHLLRSMCMLIMPLSFVAALYAAGPAHMIWALFWVAPLMALAIAWRWMPEPTQRALSAHAWWTSAACTLAAALVYWPRQSPPAGVWPLAALAMALSFAAYVVMTRSLRTEAAQANLFYTALGVFVVLTPFMPSIWMMPTAHDAAVLFGIGAIGLAGLYTLDRAAAAAPLSLSVPGLYVYLPALAAAGWWLHGPSDARRIVLVVSIVMTLAYMWWRLPTAGTSRDVAQA